MILVLGCLTALGPMSIDLYLPAFPTLESELSATSASVSATMASYFAGIAVGQMIYGPVSDVYGRRTPLLTGLILYLVGSVACAAAPTVEALVGARAVQALGGCAGMVISRAVVRDLFPPEQMAKVFSSLLLIMGMAPILAPSVGALVIDEWGWRALFLVMSAFAALCFVGTYTKIPHTESSTDKTLSFSGSLRTFKELLAHRGFLAYTLAAMAIRCGLFAYITGSPFLFQQHYGLSEKQFGVLFGANAALFVIGAQLNQKLVARFGYAKTCALVLGATSLSTLPLLWVAWQGDGSLLLVEGSVLLFIGSLGFTLPSSTAGSLEDQPDRAGSASALMGLMGSVTAAFAALGVGYLQKQTPMALPLLVGAGCLLAFLLFAAVYPWRETTVAAAPPAR